MEKRDFKGIWIPKEIWLSEELTLQEKVFFVEINSLDGEHGCYANNEYFSKFFNVSKTRVSEVINSLVKKGYIALQLIPEEGNKRILKTLLKETLRPSQTFLEDPLKEKFKHNNTVNNTENKRNISIVGVEAVLQKTPIETPTPPPPTPPKKTPQSQKYSEDFEAFWKLYDKADGGGKKQCYDKWVKLPVEEKGLIMVHVADYKKKQPDPQYRKNPITYFNQKPWIDFVPKNELTQPKRNERIDTRLLWGEPA